MISDTFKQCSEQLQIVQQNSAYENRLSEMWYSMEIALISVYRVYRTNRPAAVQIMVNLRLRCVVALRIKQTACKMQRGCNVWATTWTCKRWPVFLSKSNHNLLLMQMQPFNHTIVYDKQKCETFFFSNFTPLLLCCVCVVFFFRRLRIYTLVN